MHGVPYVKHQSHCDDTITKGHTEISANHGVVEDLLGCQRTDIVQQMEQNGSQHCLTDRSLCYRCTSDQNRRYTECSHLFMSVIGIHRTQILIENNLSPGC